MHNRINFCHELDSNPQPIDRHVNFSQLYYHHSTLYMGIEISSAMRKLVCVWESSSFVRLQFQMWNIKQTVPPSAGNYILRLWMLVCIRSSNCGCMSCKLSAYWSWQFRVRRNWFSLLNGSVIDLCFFCTWHGLKLGHDRSTWWLSAYQVYLMVVWFLFMWIDSSNYF